MERQQQKVMIDYSKEVFLLIWAIFKTGQYEFSLNVSILATLWNYRDFLKCSKTKNKLYLTRMQGLQSDRCLSWDCRNFYVFSIHFLLFFWAVCFGVAARSAIFLSFSHGELWMLAQNTFRRATCSAELHLMAFRLAGWRKCSKHRKCATKGID